MKKIGFIGLGLIGGSIAKAIRQYHPSIKLYGHASRQSTLVMANAEGVIENADFLPLEEFGTMDVVFLCSPVTLNIQYLEQLAPVVKSDCLLTDVGSVKGEIQRKAQILGISSQFIGGHPMTGSEKDGFAHASPKLLENAYYILTRDEAVSPERFQAFSAFLSSLGVVTLETTSETHDYATAAISHLPHVISAVLVQLVKEHDTPEGILRTIAAGGFKDITRISSSSPVMWQNICVENRDEILRLIDLYEITLKRTRKLIQNKETENLLSFFSEVKEYRDSMPVQEKGLLPQANDFYLDLKDEAGQIAIVAMLLATVGISIKNIGIIHNREFEQGVLHIELYDKKTKEQAMHTLTEHGYTVHKRD